MTAKERISLRDRKYDTVRSAVTWRRGESTNQRVTHVHRRNSVKEEHIFHLPG